MYASAKIPWLIRPTAPLIARMTARYISHHRSRLLPDSMPIEPALLSPLEGFFSLEILEQTRVIRATIPNPNFYPLVKLMGIDGVLEMSSIGAITLLDLVAYPDRLDRSTLFHELVHAVQYRVLGLHRFANLYVRGFLNGGGYDGIPLERQAYELEVRFSQNPKRVFSVEDDVIQRRKAGRLSPGMGLR